jgi:hypothetical protein
MIDYTRLRKKLIPEPDGEPHIVMRTGTISQVNANGTVDLLMSDGTIVPGVSRLANVAVWVGLVVQILSFRGSLLVLGSSAQSAAGASPGRVATTTRTADSSAVAGVETVSDSVTAYLVAGSRYRIRWTAAVNSTVSADTAFVRIREDNLAGAQLQLERVTMPLTGGTGTRYPAHLEVEFVAVATGNKTFVSTYIRASGSGNVNVAAASNFPVYLYVDYVGT